MTVLALIALVSSCTRQAPSPASTGTNPRTGAAAVDSTLAGASDPAGPASASSATSDQTVTAAADPTLGSTPETLVAVPPTSVAAPTTLPEPSAAALCVDRLSLRERAALIVWPGILAAEWDAATEVVAATGVGGVLLLNADGFDAEELATRLDGLRAVSRLGLIVATDEEGGTVQRLAAYRPLDSQRDVSTELTPSEARDLVASHGRFVRSLGVDMVFGPVVDVLPVEGDPPLDPSRFFSGGPDEVASFGLAYLEGWRSAGVVPVAKHFPGHGSASGDTHDVQGLTPPLAELEARDLGPYRHLAASRPAVMVGHLTVPDLTDGEPASRSPAAVDYLRSTLGYGDVLVVSDGLGMAAVGRSLPDAAVSTIAAGVDVAVFTDTSQTAAVVDAIVAAVDDGTLSPARVSQAATRVVATADPNAERC